MDPHPCQHVAYEPLVSGNVDEPEHVIRVQRVVREPEVDRQPSFLLLREAIGVDPGERVHQRGLAVVDVSRGGDDHGATPRSSRVRTLASSSWQRRMRGRAAPDTGMSAVPTWST